MKLRPLTLTDVQVKLTTDKEDIDFRKDHFCSGEPEKDDEIIREIWHRLWQGDQWAWCIVTVEVTWNGWRETDSLGCCSYKDEADFKQDSQYNVMVEEAIDRLNLTLQRQCDQLDELVEPLKEGSLVTELLDSIEGILPSADFQTDNQGQIIIYTCLSSVTDPNDKDIEILAPVGDEN